MRFTAALLSTTTALLSLPAQEPSIDLAGDHFELVCHFDDRGIAERALEVVEATWDTALKLYGAEGPPLAAPLEVHLYRNAAAYAAAEAKLTGGVFRRNLAFAHWDTKTAHVAVQPELSDAALEQIGLSTQTLRLLSHEAAHLVRFHTMPNYRAHPGWFADGNASWIEVQVLRDKQLLDEPEADPGFSTNVFRVQKLIQEQRLPPVADVLLDRTDKLQFYERYSIRWLLFRFLMARHRKSMSRAIADLRGLRNGGDFTPRAAAAVRKRIGSSAFRKIDSEFRRYTMALHPQWEQVYRSLEATGESWVQTAFRSTNAIAWQTKPVAPDSYDVTGTVTLLPGRSTQLNVLLGRSDDGFVSVAFTAGFGITVFEFHQRTGRFQRLAQHRARLPTGTPIRFRTSYLAGGELSVDVDGEQALELEVQRDLNGPWGLGAQAGSAGIWRAVTLKPRR